MLVLFVAYSKVELTVQLQYKRARRALLIRAYNLIGYDKRCKGNNCEGRADKRKKGAVVSWRQGRLP